MSQKKGTDNYRVTNMLLSQYIVVEKHKGRPKPRSPFLSSAGHVQPVPLTLTFPSFLSSAINKMPVAFAQVILRLRASFSGIHIEEGEHV